MAGAPSARRHRSQKVTMRWLFISFVIAGLACGVSAKSADEPLEVLKARAENARPQDQSLLFAAIASREVNEADRFYTEGDIPKATQAVDEVVRYAGRAVEAAQKSGKHLKNTEISLRATARRLEDVRKTLSFEDRSYVEAAVKQVERFRQKLLEQMFGPQSKENKK
jgi:hypothetical protein